MTDPTSWNTQLEVNLRAAIEGVIADMIDEGVDFPWMSDAIRNRMASAAVSVLEAVAYHEMWLERMGGLEKDWIP